MDHLQEETVDGYKSQSQASHCESESFSCSTIEFSVLLDAETSLGEWCPVFRDGTPPSSINVRQLIIDGNTTASQNIRHQSLNDKAQCPRMENSNHTLLVILSVLKHLYKESVKIISSVLSLK